MAVWLISRVTYCKFGEYAVAFFGFLTDMDYYVIVVRELVPDVISFMAAYRVVLVVRHLTFVWSGLVPLSSSATAQHLAKLHCRIHFDCYLFKIFTSIVIRRRLIDSSFVVVTITGQKSRRRRFRHCSSTAWQTVQIGPPSTCQLACSRSISTCWHHSSAGSFCLPVCHLDRLQSVVNAVRRVWSADPGNLTTWRHCCTTFTDYESRFSFWFWHTGARMDLHFSTLLMTFTRWQRSSHGDGCVRRRLRHWSSQPLVHSGTTIGDRAFSVGAARAWNSLPLYVISVPSGFLVAS